jgi:hypothetical protein
MLDPNRKPYSADELRAIIPDWRSTGASIAQARFAVEYLTNGFNGELAYRTAVNGNLGKQKAAINAAIMLKDPITVKLQAMFTDQWLAEKKIKLEKEIIDTLWAQAFYDPSLYMDLTGDVGFKAWSDLTEVQRRVVEGIETKFFGKDAQCSQTTITLTKRQPALMALAQYIAIMKGLPATNGNASLTPETELLLHTIFNKAKPGRADSADNGAQTRKAQCNFRKGLGAPAGAAG